MPTNKKQNNYEILLELVKKSGIFDKRYYSSHYDDVKNSPLSPLEHFITIGINKHRSPNSEFNPQWYYKKNIDIQKAGINPIIHYIRHGYKENREINKKLKFSIDSYCPHTTKLIGGITNYDNGQIVGWFNSNKNFLPLLFIDSKLCKIVQTKIKMPDIAEKFKTDRENIGFIAEAQTNLSSSNTIELYAVFSDYCKLITSTNKFHINNVVSSSLSKLSELKEVSEKKDAVLITVWDCTHNPLGRAKVLYEIIQNANRPVFIVGFDFKFSKHGIWEPLTNSNIKLFSLKWNEKEIFKHIVDEMGISFSTIWICKPRLAGFVLADIFSNKDTKFILDIDDNEKAMSKGEESQLKPYGILSNYLSESITKNIKAKSIASVSIKEKWGGKFVRHARAELDKKSYKKRAYLPENINIGFFGTVRPHKNMQEAARAVQLFALHNNINITLTVGGHFIPATLEDEILSFGAQTIGEIKNDELNDVLTTMDILITGYPTTQSEDEITKYQISSKIADSLSLGRAVLVPYSSSVKDLDKINGIYLFNKENFSQKLKEAIDNKEKIKLSKIFTYSYNYQQFLKLEKIAKEQQKKDIFTVPILSKTLSKKPLVPTLVLVWKQADSTLYGRRVDQIARSYKKKHPKHKVIILETVAQDRLKQYEDNKDLFAGDDALILDRLKTKKINLTIDGIEHHVLIDTNYEETLRDFLLVNRVLASNSVFILFPIVEQLNTLISLIDNYKIIIDVVDNQLGWSSKYPEQIVSQYKILTKLSDSILFNSQKNRDFFYKQNLLDKEQESELITNWYELPKIYIDKSLTLATSKEIKLFYSGNMNDRIDWTLIKNLLEELPQYVTLYLIGNAQRCVDDIKAILEVHTNCIYLGPLDERTLLEFISSCHLGIMPHSIESTSKYMNPLKVYMYAALGLECVSTNVPGLESKFKNLTITQDSISFITTCINKIKSLKSKDITKHKPENLTDIYKTSRDVYMELIERKFNSD